MVLYSLIAIPNSMTPLTSFNYDVTFMVASKWPEIGFNTLPKVFSVKVSFNPR
jgi:hypothetical protein